MGLKKKSNLIKVKTALAEKWERKANTSGSKPLRRTLVNRAARYRRVAAELERDATK